MKEIKDINKQEYDAYMRLKTAKQKGTKAEWNDINLIWSTFIAKSTVCKTCGTMVSNAFAKIIKFFDAKKSELPNFDLIENVIEPQGSNTNVYLPTQLEQKLIAKIEKHGVSTRNQPAYNDEDYYKTRKTEKDKKACLWCATMFTPTTNMQKFCTTTCRGKMNEYKQKQRADYLNNIRNNYDNL